MIKKKKFIRSSSSILFVAIIIWFVVDRVGDIVGTDIDKSAYYLTDDELSGLFSDTTLAKNKCQVTRVADGDTIDVRCPFRNEETIRYAHIDTPEVWKKVNGKWQEDNQCYGKEASNINKELVEGKKVWVLDQSFTTDVYNRRIANVIVNEGKDKNLNVNVFLLGEGFATAYYSINPLDKFLNTGKEENIEYFESKAKKNNKGLWGKCY